jgi:hypothetical protein
VKEIKNTPIHVQLWRILMMVCGKIWLKFWKSPIISDQKSQNVREVESASCLPVEWERETDGHVQNLPQLYPVQVALEVLGVILSTPQNTCSQFRAQRHFHQVYPCLEHKTILWVNFISVEGIHLEKCHYVSLPAVPSLRTLGCITLCHLEYLTYNLCSESNLRWSAFLSLSCP